MCQIIQNYWFTNGLLGENVTLAKMVCAIGQELTLLIYDIRNIIATIYSLSIDYDRLKYGAAPIVIIPTVSEYSIHEVETA